MGVVATGARCFLRRLFSLLLPANFFRRNRMYSIKTSTTPSKTNIKMDFVSISGRPGACHKKTVVGTHRKLKRRRRKKILFMLVHLAVGQEAISASPLQELILEKPKVFRRSCGRYSSHVDERAGVPRGHLGQPRSSNPQLRDLRNTLFS